MQDSISTSPVWKKQVAHKFAHRSNPDGTVDTICIRCFQTVATVFDDTELPRLEQDHRCDPEIAARFEYSDLRYQEVEESKES